MVLLIMARIAVLCILCSSAFAKDTAIFKTSEHPVATGNMQQDIMEKSDIDHLRRELSAYKELSLSSIDQNKQNTNTFILAMAALIIVIGWFNFQRVQSERKNIEESIRSDTKQFLEKEMSNINLSYAQILKHSEAMIESRDSEKKSTKLEIKNELEKAKKETATLLYEYIDGYLQQSISETNEFKMDVIKFILEFRRRTRGLEDILTWAKKYHKLINGDVFNSLGFQSAINDNIFTTLSRMTEIDKKHKIAVAEVLDMLDQLPESLKQPTLELLNILEEKADFMEQLLSYDSKKSVLEEKKKQLDELRHKREE